MGTNILEEPSASIVMLMIEGTDIYEILKPISQNIGNHMPEDGTRSFSNLLTQLKLMH
jgi:hypothetical protein